MFPLEVKYDEYLGPTKPHRATGKQRTEQAKMYFAGSLVKLCQKQYDFVFLGVVSSTNSVSPWCCFLSQGGDFKSTRPIATHPLGPYSVLLFLPLQPTMPLNSAPSLRATSMLSLHCAIWEKRD